MAGSNLVERSSIERRLRALERGQSRAVAAVGGGSNWRHDITMAGSITGSVFTLNYSDLIQESVILVHPMLEPQPGVHFTVIGATLTLTGWTAFEVGDPITIANFNNFYVHSARRGI